MVDSVIVRRILMSRLGPNPQSTVGAAIGLVAVFQTWLVREVTWFSFHIRMSPDLLRQFEETTMILPGLREFNLFDLILADYLGLSLFCAVFLAGTLISVVSPVGAVPQMVGLVGFVLGYHALDLTIQSPSGSPVFSVGLGYALGLVSTFIVLQSPVRAMLAANRGRPVRMLGRFAALSPRTISSWR
jgi:hypothetical protein